MAPHLPGGNLPASSRVQEAPQNSPVWKGCAGSDIEVPCHLALPVTSFVSQLSHNLSRPQIPHLCDQQMHEMHVNMSPEG